MHEYHGLATIEFLENWLGIGMTQPLFVVAGDQLNSVGLKDTIGGLNFAKARLGIWKGDDGKQAEAPPVRSYDIGGVFVGSPRHVRCRLSVAEPKNTRREGQNRRRYSLLVH